MQVKMIIKISGIIIGLLVSISASYAAINDWTNLYDQQFKIEQQLMKQQFRQMQQEFRMQQQYMELHPTQQSIWQNLRSSPISRERLDWPLNFIGRVFNLNWFGRNVTGGQWYVYDRDERNQFPLGDTTVRGRNSFDDAARKHDIQYYINTHFDRGTWVQIPGPKGVEYFRSLGGGLPQAWWTNIIVARDMLLGNLAHHGGRTSLPLGKDAVPLRGDSAISNNLLSDKLICQTTTRTYRHETFSGSEFNRSYGNQSLTTPQWQTNCRMPQTNWNNSGTNTINNYSWNNTTSNIFRNYKWNNSNTINMNNYKWNNSNTINMNNYKWNNSNK